MFLDYEVNYPIADNSQMCPVHFLPKNGWMTVVSNANNVLDLMGQVIEWRVCMDYQKLNVWAEKDNFPIPFLDQLSETLLVKRSYYFIDRYLG